MPFVQIFLRERQDPIDPLHISSALQQALSETFNVSPTDSVFAFNVYPADRLTFDAQFTGTPRSGDLTTVQITCNAGRSTEMKRALYARTAQLLSEHAGIAPADLVISLIEVPAENWSFANGLMP